MGQAFKREERTRKGRWRDITEDTTGLIFLITVTMSTLATMKIFMTGTYRVLSALNRRSVLGEGNTIEILNHDHAGKRQDISRQATDGRSAGDRIRRRSEWAGNTRIGWAGKEGR